MYQPEAGRNSGELLKEVETAFYQLLGAAPDAVLVADCSGCILLVNDMVERTFGYSADELIGNSVETLVPSQFREVHARQRSDFFDAPVPRYMSDQCRLRAVRKDGTEFPVEISLNPIQSGGACLAVCTVRDMSECKRAERKLRESEERLQAILDNATAVVYVKDPSGRYKQVNRRFEELFHVDKEQVAGMTDYDLFPKGLADTCLANDRKVLENRAAMEFDEVAHLDDGEHTYLSLKFPLCRADGAPYAVCGISTDITERKRMEDDLEQQAKDLERSNAELQQFAYVASHDLQEPLRMVASYAQLLARRYEGRLDSDAEEFIGFMVDGAMRMQELINDLLAYSRVGTKGGEFQLTDCDQVLEGVLGNLRAAIAATGAEIACEPLPAVRADASQLVQVFQNLIANALKFRGDRPPKIRIGAREEADEVVFSVSDNGIGMEPKYAERVFLIFQRLYTQRDYPGTGIGLAICKKIVERHGGRIWVESQPGQGATFHFVMRSRAGEG